MLTISYKNSRRLLITVFVVVLAVLTLAAYHVYASWLKVYDYSQAAKLHKDHNLIQAEALYSKADKNRSIQYKDTEIASALSELKPVTEIKSVLIGIGERTRQADKGDDFKALLAVYQDYLAKKKESAGKGGSYDSIFTEMATLDKIGNHLKDAFKNTEAKISKDLQSSAKKRAFTDDSVVALLQIPTDYYSGDAPRLEVIRAKLEPYDGARIETVAGEKGMLAAMKEAVRLQKLYQDNGSDGGWLGAQVEAAAAGILSKLLEKNDMAGFWQSAKAFEDGGVKAFGLAGGDGSKTLQLIKDKYAKQVAVAEQLAGDRKYADAIALYSTLNDYRDNGKRIQDVELKWTSTEPDHLLQKVMKGASFGSVFNGSDQFGAVVYAVGVTEGKIVLARLTSDMQTDKREGTIDAGVKVKDIRVIGSVRPQGPPALLVQGASSSRKSRYVAYEVADSVLRKVFDFEADGYQYQNDGNGVMIVNNDNGSGAGQQAYYEYRNGQYSFTKIKPDYVEIALGNLGNYKGVKVRFTCNIVAADDNAAIVIDNGTYIVLTSTKLRTGPATITGTWNGNQDIKKGAQTISALNVQVSAALQ